MSDTIPLVSIFGHVKNARKTVHRWVNSVLALECANYEFVIQDGVSTDGTLEILQDYARRHPQIIKLVSEPDACGEEAFFRALTRCRGRYIGSCLSDEAMLPIGAQWAIEAFQRHPDAGAVYGDLFITDHEGRTTSEFTAPHPFTIEKYLLHEVNPPFASTFFRREALESIDFRTHSWTFGMGEFELWVRLGLKYPVYYQPGRIATYAVHPGQLSARKDIVITLLRTRCEYFKRLFGREDVRRRFGKIQQQAVGGAHLFAAEVLRDSGAYPEAAEVLLEGAAYRPTAEMLKRLMLGFYHQGVTLEHEKRFADAITCFEPLAKLGVEIPQLEGLKRKVAAAALPPMAGGERLAQSAAGERVPQVSVIVLCHNYAEHLRIAVASVLAQTYHDFEVIVIDDGSTDESLAVARQLTAEHGTGGKLRVFHLEDVGPSAARSFGIGQARGRYVLPLDADDRIAPDFLARTVPLLDDDSKLGFAYVDTVYFGETEQRCHQPEYDFARLCAANFISYCSLIRRAAFEAVSGYDPSNWGYYEDWDLWLRLGQAGWFGRHIAEPLFFYRQHFATSLSFYAQRLNPIYQAFVLTRRPQLHSSAAVAAAESVLAEMPPGWHARPPLKSIGAIQELLTRHPDNRHLLFFFAVAQSRDGATAAASATLARLLALHPEDEQAQTLLAQIQKPAAGDPLVTVVVPCFRQAHYLAEAVASVVAQTYRHWELVIVNDGSPDETNRVARELIALHSDRVIRLVEKANGGLADARNAGIRAAQGELILPLDADDKIHPEMLAKTVGLLQRHPEIAIAYTDYVYFGHQQQRLYTTEYNFQTLCTAYNLFTCCALYRRSAWKAVGGYNPNMIYGYEDWDFWIGCGERGFIGQRIPEVLFYYRTKAESMVSTAHQHHRTLFARIVLNHPRVYAPSVTADAAQILAAAGWLNAPAVEAPGGASPLVSICIPTFNGEEFLAETIASAIAQSYPAIEIILSDDSSTDRTFAVAAAALNSARCPITLERHARLGLVGNWNHCVRVARGKYIKFLFQDDLLEPDCVAEMVARAECDPAVGLVFSPRRIEIRAQTAALAAAHREGLDLHKGWTSLFSLQSGTALLSDPRLLHDPINKVGEPTTVLLAKAALESLGGFDENLKQLVDVEMWLRIMTRYKVAFIDRTLSCFRLHAKQATQDNMKAGLIGEDWKRFFRKLATDPVFASLPPNQREHAGQALARLGGGAPTGAPSAALRPPDAAAQIENFKTAMQRVKQLVKDQRFADAVAAAEAALPLAPTPAGVAQATEILAMIRGAAPNPANLAAAPQRPDPQHFFGSSEIKNIEQLIATYTADPTSPAALAPLGELRRSLVAFLQTLDETKAEQLFGGDFGQVYRALLKAGLPGVPPAPITSDTDDASLRNLLARMLLAPAHLNREAFGWESVPAWFRDDYLAYMLYAPAIFGAAGEADLYRDHMRACVTAILQRIRTAPRDPLTVNAALYFTLKANFIPLYFTEANTRELAEKRAAIMEFILEKNGAALNAIFKKRPASRKKIKVGFLNAHFITQTETHVTLPGLHLDRERFEVCLFPIAAAGGPLEDYCRSLADQFIPLPSDLPRQVATIREATLDAIIIGTNVTAVTNSVALLALHRLAPVQLVSYCSPVSTGMRHVDGYLTGTLANFPGAAKHFSERLLFCPGTPGCLDYTVEKQEPTRRFDRQTLGIGDDEIVFINAAACFKILPEMQETWAKILRAVARSRLVLLPFNPNWATSFPVKQFAGTLAAAFRRHGVAEDRFLLTPSLPSRADVKALEKLADVYLDTFPFSGSISVFDPLELGLPTVIWEGKTPRSRMAATMLRELEIPELIAFDEATYIEITVRLATDSAWRAQIRQRILVGMSRQPGFSNPAQYGAHLGDLLEELVRGKKSSAVRTDRSSAPAPRALVA
jgi:glycosyltransferase involved in cell wall biosynthesis/predicted O-linked N-acetylglucosamine transferase (SPINDLY family)